MIQRLKCIHIYFSDEIMRKLKKEDYNEMIKEWQEYQKMRQGNGDCRSNTTNKIARNENNYTPHTNIILSKAATTDHQKGTIIGGQNEQIQRKRNN